MCNKFFLQPLFGQLTRQRYFRASPAALLGATARCGRAAKRSASVHWVFFLALWVLASAYPAGTACAQLPLTGPQALVLLDVSGQQRIDEVARRFAAGEGAPARPEQVMPISAGRAAWYRLELPPLPSTAAHLLVLPHPGLDTADLYTSALAADGAALWRVQHSGDRLAVQDWALPNLYPAFNVPVGPGVRAPMYLRVANIYPVSVSWQLVDAAAFQNDIKRWYLMLGVYLGLMLLTLAVSCVQAVAWQERIHFWYATFVAVATLTQLAATGLAGEYFWPAAAWWNDRSFSTLPIASSVLLHLLLKRLMSEQLARWGRHWLLFISGLGLVVMAGSLAPDRAPFIPTFAPYYLLSLLTYLAAAAWYAWRLPRVGMWVLAAVVCLCSGAIFPVLRLLGELPSTIATQYGAQAGVAFQIPLLMVALFFRSREKRANLLRMGALQRIDPLTGMGNHWVLLQQITRLQRASSSSGAVMRIRISNIQAVRKDHGLQGAQAAVVHAGALAAALMPEGDSVARHRDGDLLLVLKGPVTRAWLLDAGQRLIARGLAGVSGAVPLVSLQLKIAVLVAPFEPVEPTALLQLLDSLIQGMAQRSGTGLRIAGQRSRTAPDTAR